MVFHRALVQIEYPLERLMPLVHLFQEKYNDEVVPRILEVCIEMDKVRVLTKSFPLCVPQKTVRNMVRNACVEQAQRWTPNQATFFNGICSMV